MRGADEALRAIVEARPGRGGGQPLDNRSEARSESTEAEREEIGGVRVVTAEQFVAALPRERDLYVFCGKLRHEVGRQRARVRERLVERVGERREEQRRIRPQHELAVQGAVLLRHEPRIGELVERALLEADGERAQRIVGFLGRKRRERARVDAAREQHADRNVADEMRADGVAKAPAELLHEFGLVVVTGLECGRRPRVPRKHRLTAFPDERVTRGQLVDVAKDRERRRHGVEGEERLERIEVDRTARERAQLGCELDAAFGHAVVQRLDAVTVAREHEPAFASVPDGDGEHPAEPLREARPPLLVCVHEHLGVALRAEPVAGACKLARELAVVVDLAVLHDHDGAVLVHDRLVSLRNVDDREPACREADRPVDERAVGVRPAVNERRAHRSEPGGIDGAADRRDSADPAHAALL